MPDKIIAARVHGSPADVTVIGNVRHHAPAGVRASLGSSSLVYVIVIDDLAPNGYPKV